MCTDRRIRRRRRRRCARLTSIHVHIDAGN